MLTYMQGFEEHRIPHLVFAKPEVHRSSIRLMLPDLCGNRDSEVPVEVRREVFKEMRRAVVSVCGQLHDGVWPATYEAEEKRARGKGRGRLQVSGKLIKKEKVGAFGRKFLRNLQAHWWGKNAYYFHEVQGVRGAHQHRTSRAEAAREKFLSMIDVNSIRKQDWYIDVGLEASAPEQVLWWDIGGHRWLINEIIGRTNNNNEVGNEAEDSDYDDWMEEDGDSGDEEYEEDGDDEDGDDEDGEEEDGYDVDEEEEVEEVEDDEDVAENLMEGRRHYTFDPCCQMFDVGGFRLTTTEAIRLRTGVYYIQAYCTEKIATYQQAGQALQFDYSSILDAASYSKLQKQGENILEIFEAFSSHKVAGNARLEVRVRLDKVEDLNPINLRGDNLSRTMFSFPSDTYW
jgi:hypothetical protein